MKKFKKSAVAAAVGAIALTGTLAVPAVDAAGSWKPVSGATSWGPCDWYTSTNLRYVSSGGSNIRLNLSSTGPLGVKFRVKFENTGLTSTIVYVPPINTVQTLAGTQPAGTPFRNQFTCVNPRAAGTSPITDFAGSQFY